MKVRPGDTIQIRDLVTVDGDAVAVPDPTRLTHLQFRRFAGCPICSVHLQSVAARHGEITAAGIHEVVVFHSTPHELRSYTTDLPLDVVADPDKQLYMKFGAETSLRAVLDPRALAQVLKAMLAAGSSITPDALRLSQRLAAMPDQAPHTPSRPGSNDEAAISSGSRQRRCGSGDRRSDAA